MAAKGGGVALKLVLFCVVLYFLVRYAFVVSKSQREEQLPVIVIPGGGLSADGQLPDYVIARMKKAIELFELSKNKPSPCGRGPCLITLSAGTPHVAPPRDSKDFPLFEATVGAQFLLDAGIPASNILEEKLSLDTLGNAYFLRTIHTDPNEWTKLTIITNKWHMPRVQAIFNTVFSSPPNSGLSSKYLLQYEAVDDILSPDVLELRRDREKQSLLTFNRNTVPLLQSLADIHHFVFWNHKAYTTARLQSNFVPEKIDPKLLKSY